MCAKGRFGLLLVIAVSVLFALLVLSASAQAQSETVLYSFTGGADGGQPQSRLTLDSAGNLYGTTFSGGVACPESSLGCGVVFELSPNGAGGWIETVLYTFSGGADGGFPAYSPVIFDSAGNLYGTTSRGGTTATGCAGYGCGVVFKLSPVGTGWEETVLYNFCSQPNCADGQYPGGGLIMDSSGNLYGSNWSGVFELSLSGGSWIEKIIYPIEMIDPSAGLIVDAFGNIFGIGSSSYKGLKVFKLSPNGQSGWNATVIHTFRPVDSYYSVGGTPALDKAGNLIGTTESLINGNAYVYKLTLGRTGTWRVSFLWRKYHEGSYAGVVLDASGNVYGASRSFVYELLAGTYQEKPLGNVNLGNDLILDSAGTLFGTSFNGGLSSSGTAFEVSP